MPVETKLPEAVPRLNLLRALAVLCLVASCVLLVAEFWSDPLGVPPGGLMIAGAIFCLAANLFALILLVARRRRGAP